MIVLRESRSGHREGHKSAAVPAGGADSRWGHARGIADHKASDVGTEPSLRLLFWLSCAFVIYAYVGYAVVLFAITRWRQKPVIRRAILPRVSVVIAARNEEQRLPGKLANLASVDYPRELLEIIIVSDGSTDGTDQVLLAAGSAVVPVLLPALAERPGGKAVALNEGVRRATGEILVFLDARQVVAPDAVAELVSCFADPEVGAVSGELLLESAAGATEGLGIYWKIEKTVRKLESASGSTVGVTGAIYAMRRELFREIPPGTILDDVYVPMTVARQGKRVVFLPSAVARDRLFVEKGKEFSRKVRTLTGNYQLLRLAPWILSSSNPLLFRFLSHKLARLLVPLCLLLMLVTSAVAGGPLYRSLFLLQIFVYLLASVGSIVPRSQQFKPVGIAQTFVMLNVAASLAFYNFVAGRNRLWIR